MTISKKRFDTLISTVPQSVAVVYDAVPINAPWTAWQVHQELTRTNKARDLNNTRGCLDKLVRLGVVHEPKRGEFVREKVRDAAETTTADLYSSLDEVSFDEYSKETEEQEMNKLGVPPNSVGTTVELTLIEKLDKVGAMLKGIADTVKAAATEVESLAIEVDDSLKNKDADAEKLNQLRTILKSLG